MYSWSRLPIKRVSKLVLIWLKPPLICASHGALASIPCLGVLRDKYIRHTSDLLLRACNSKVAGDS
ncbi:hypothetical protein Csa_020610 [Cucumis sativus]|uniref:Uncharacterized protein n=1 Tax=Cucumis sativus TaxID=3659 RepID=A0A0A0KB31_CUCSA|nr:hypothetical protein Csa_020610 [Cucumis sativus]